MSESSNTALDRGFFGHPKGLQTLFFTEMWERMSYYGMRGLLVLFLTASINDGGFAYTAAVASAIYGLYTASVYFMGLPGGWMADRLIGSQRAVWYGGIIIMCGHISLAIPNDKTFYIGLILVVLGTGLLKPSISALVGALYSSNDERRDSGYAIYYMGINIGSLIGYTVCGALSEAEGFGWHWAFGAAAVGMAFGLFQFRRTLGNLKGVGAEPLQPLTPEGSSRSWQLISVFLFGLALVTLAVMNGLLTLNPVSLAQSVAVVFTSVFVIYFSAIYFRGKLTAVEKKGMLALLLVCIASACFWSGFEQAGSTLNLFARDYTERSTDALKFLGLLEIPTVWFQSANSTFIILLSPFFAAMWIKLGRRMVSPAYGIKCAVGLIIMASGFIAMYYAAQIAAAGMKAAAFWLILTYFLHTCGELIISPIALSAVSKLSPKRYMGQMMGVFVLTYSIGSIIAGIFAGKFDPNNVTEMPNLYMQIVTFSVGVGAVVLLFALFTKNWETEVQEARVAEENEQNKATA